MMKNGKEIGIFIVEDNEVFSQTLKSDIETSFVKLPVKVQSFGTGEACMKRFNEAKPQVVILDYHLNGKNPDAADGIKVLDWIKKENIDTNVIMLTQDDNIDIALKSFRHGASDYVVKSETVFRKINYSLLYQYKMMEANHNAARYKQILFVTVLCIIIVIGIVIAIQLINPSIINR